MERNALFFRTLIFAAGVAVALALFVAPACAGGGDSRFDGGGREARAQVRAALNASSFDWDVVPVRVTVHIRRGVSPHATPGEIWLDPRLLAAGRFAWGIVQHEYAHQVAYFLVGKQHRERLIRTLGARAWCHGRIGLAHHDRACELFVETLTWAFWPSRHNIAHPARHADDAARARRFVARAAGLRAG
jgi:hypothetical protein